MAPYKAQAILVNMVDSNIVTGQSDQVDLHHQSSLNSIKCVYPLIIITSSSTAGRLISGFVCWFLFQISFANELKKYCKEKMPFTVLTASHTGSLLKMFFFFFLKKNYNTFARKSRLREVILSQRFKPGKILLFQKGGLLAGRRWTRMGFSDCQSLSVGSITVLLL